MRGNDGRKLDHTTLETLRLRAVNQVRQGASPADVAAALGLHRSTVYGWLAKYRDGGRGALLARPVPGRPPRLTPLQMRKLCTLIAETDPRQLQLGFALWTRQMVRELICREFGVDLSIVSVGRLLAKTGLSPHQRTGCSGCEQNDAGAVGRWKEQDYPAIAAAAAAKGAAIYFVDEARIRSGRHTDTTWAPAGQSLLVEAAGGRFGVDIISAIPPQGTLRFAVFEAATATAITAKSFIEFCKRLIHDTPGPVYLIVDGHRCHRAQAVKDYLASAGGRLKLFFLPGYSPGLTWGLRVCCLLHCGRLHLVSSSQAG